MFKHIRQYIINTPGYVIIGQLLAISLIIYGIAVIGPWYPPTLATTVAFAFQTVIGRVFAGLIYIGSGCLYLASYEDRGMARWGALAISMCFFFTMFVRLIIVGFSPAIWIFLLCLSAISVIVYLKTVLGGMV